ncbi:MAG: sodium/proline symporter [Lachnospiraceae bacterium]|nr:sodium/proline symporter [Lachnospiraceae bacterium]
MATSQICIIAVIILYLAFVLVIGVKFSRTNKTTEDYYLGGRKLGPLVTAMSAEASDMSSWLLLGIPGLAYAGGFADPFWTSLGLAVGTYLNWLFVARKLRRYSQINNSPTIPSFFSNRFGDDRNILSLISAIVIIIFFVPYTASGFSACGKLFNSLFGVDYTVAMIIFALVIIAYTALGGFLAASTSDLVQSIIMTIALGTILFYGASQAGGWGAVFDNARSLAGYFDLNNMHVDGSASPYNLLTKISTLAWGLGYFGMPHILLRFMAIEKEEKLTLSRRIATIWVVIAMFSAIIIGFVARAMTANGTIASLDDPETAIIAISALLSSHGVFTACVAGLILAGILAATMSTADSQLLAAASSASDDICKKFIMKKMDSKTSMLVARGAVIIMSIIALFIAKNPDSSVFQIVSFAWAGFGAAFGPLMLCALFWKRTNKYGALAGMISGGVMIFVWKFLVRPLGGVWNIYELLPGFIVSLFFIVIVSLVTPAPDAKVLDDFDKANEK